MDFNLTRVLGITRMRRRLSKNRTSKAAIAQDDNAPTGTQSQEEGTSSGHPSRIATFQDLDPQGEIVIEAGDGSDALDIRVSGDALRLASRSLGAMLANGGLETQKKRISLLEDKPRIVLALCKIIHHKAEANTLHTLDARDICDLVVMADMHECIDMIRPWLADRFVGFNRYEIGRGDRSIKLYHDGPDGYM